MTSWWEAIRRVSAYLQDLTGRVGQIACYMQADFEKRVNPNDQAQMSLLEEMRAHVKKVWLGLYGVVLSQIIFEASSAHC